MTDIEKMQEEFEKIAEEVLQMEIEEAENGKEPEGGYAEFVYLNENGAIEEK